MKVPSFRPGPNAALSRLGLAPRMVANFDSTTAMVRSLSSSLKGKGFAGAGAMPPSEALAAVLNALPRPVRERLYMAGGLKEAIPQRKLPHMRNEVVARWFTGMYPGRRYPGVAIGSTNGALNHLWASMQVPWLPQTYLVPVRHFTVHPDEPRDSFEHFQKAARLLLDANPDLQLHHMHDANQDRLMIHYMMYFRVKMLRLAEAYKQFILQNVEHGGTIYIAECNQVWPTTQVGERHIFQHGAVGGASPEEFDKGGPRVEAYLERYQSHRRRWEAPEPDGTRPEAEWGWEPALGPDIERFARRHGYRIRRVVFEEPEDPSPLVCDLHRWWYAKRRMRSNRLVVSSFMLTDPHLTLTTGSCPFWMTFNKMPSLEAVHGYLDSALPFDEIYLILFSHGVDSIGLGSVEQWKEILARARKKGRFLGVDEQAYPRDFGVFIRFHEEFKRIPARYPIMPMHQSVLDEFLSERGTEYKVEWRTEPEMAQV